MNVTTHISSDSTVTTFDGIRTRRLAATIVPPADTGLLALRAQNFVR
jgi:hypothetical protein